MKRPAPLRALIAMETPLWVAARISAAPLTIVLNGKIDCGIAIAMEDGGT